jgi:putative spermidine/putrescine transport system permease protein
MAKLASPRTRAFLVVAVLMPLWSGYLVKVYTWRTIMGGGGPIDWALEPFGLGAPTGDILRVWLVMSYLWLPYMIIPIYAGLERIPDSLLAASDDLGAKAGYTFRRVILPLVFPAVVAGSIFTFSLTLGDFITPLLVSKTQFIGNVVYSNFSNDLPLAAAFATVPIVVMIGYLLLARRLGAFEHL